jgi:SAM-dependent methyltransferase
MVAGSALDLGSSAGRMLAGLRDLGWKVTAVVTSEEAARKARQRGIPVRVGPLESHHLPGNEFDLVTFFQVVEPIPLTSRTLREFHRILRPGGRLVVAVPAFGFLQEKLFGHRWMNLDPRNPPVYFNERSLELLLELSGFTPEEVRRFSLEYSPLTWLQSLENLALRRNNVLYKMLRGEHGGLPPVTLSEAAAVAGAFVLAPAAVAAAAIAAAARQGDCIEITARKR